MNCQEIMKKIEDVDRFTVVMSPQQLRNIGEFVVIVSPALLAAAAIFHLAGAPLLPSLALEAAGMHGT
jgi:hypothetical protein